MKFKKYMLFALLFAYCITFCITAAYAEYRSPLFRLYDPGKEEVVDYEKYGEFSGVGTFSYNYTTTDIDGLAMASGEGIDPNTSAKHDPAYEELQRLGHLSGSPWKHNNTDNPQADFFAWATAFKEDPGVRLFFTANALYNAGLYIHALKAYRAAIILYPTSYCWNRELTWTWLIAPAAWDQIINITRMHPELGLKPSGMLVKTDVALGGDPKKNLVAVTPGTLLKVPDEENINEVVSIESMRIIERRGGKRVACIKYENGQWGLEVDGKPFLVKGLTFTPTKVGKNYDWDWMHADKNKNGLNDVAYETWIDKNRNNRRDPNEPVLGDFKLMQDMGCNTIRIFNTIPINKRLLRELYDRFGIMVLICDPVGAYTVNSGANWSDGTDYTDRLQRKRMKDAVIETVNRYKDEEWLLGYILGNENNMSCDYTGVNASRTRAASQPKDYAEFLNELATTIHELDPDHIVGVGNMELGLVDAYAIYADELDFIGVNSYPGKYGFGSLWIRAKNTMDRPVLITEFGCDAYATGEGPDEESQAEYLKNAWEDIIYNSLDNPGEGNSIGGIIFEWCDEWWKDTRGDPWDEHNTEPTVELAFPDGFSQEEWLGIVGQGNGRKSPFMRVPRKAYYTMKELWKEEN